MLSVLVGSAFLFLVAAIVKMIEVKGKPPYFLAYLIVILAGFYGMISISNIIDLLIAHNPLDAGMSLVMGVVALKVTYWGLNTFKHLYMEA